MSTTIYDAYRAPLARVLDTIDWARDTLLNSTIEIVEQLMNDVVVDITTTPKHLKGEGERFYRRSQQYRHVIAAAKKAALSPYKEYHDIDCGFNLWIWDDRVYVMPVGTNVHKRALSYSKPEWVEDYSYWNNVDEPDDVSYEEWKQRGETWDMICTGTGRADHNARRLYHDVVSVNAALGTFDLEMSMIIRPFEEWIKNKK